eukprot:CAMPEP_0185833564 /NCGR_PEP_ID=MMETSP1353-20130828/3066_1 /TAXON_ID=1077150 /ORGANISM="Erythrolobus australicus, Strain CCMP3124" /LENGTH=137 /DNA_ID=CAMNT_0028531873 /DNA_START=435 /DNA_END=845 /DNA_ORIENTATION=-
MPHALAAKFARLTRPASLSAPSAAPASMLSLIATSRGAARRIAARPRSPARPLARLRPRAALSSPPPRAASLLPPRPPHRPPAASAARRIGRLHTARLLQQRTDPHIRGTSSPRAPAARTARYRLRPSRCPPHPAAG